MIKIDLLQYQSKIDFRKGKKLFDPIRKKEIVVTPEELVRQLLIIHLIEKVAYPKNKISVEKQVLVNDLPKRFDILIHDNQGKPVLLVECKAPSVKIDEAVLHQVARYNSTLRVKYFIMTNGIETHCGQINYETGEIFYLESIPSYEEVVGCQL
jgi:hypothetical protein